MRILHVDTGREMRGGQRQVLLLLRGLRDAGHSLKLLARHGAPLFVKASQDGFEVVPANSKSVWSESRRADILHAHDAHSHTLAALACKRPFVVSRRVAFGPQSGLLSRWKYRRAARYLAVSDFVRKQLLATAVPDGLIDIVGDAVDPLPNELAFSPSGKVVALQSDDPHKGKDIVQAAAKLAHVPVIYSSDLERDLPGANLFLYATRSEGLGSAALLAMSLGVPVIASRVGGMPEAVGPDAGILVDNDPPSFAEAIETVLSQPETAKHMGKAGRRRVRENFSREMLLERTLSSYARALAH